MARLRLVVKAAVIALAVVCGGAAGSAGTPANGKILFTTAWTPYAKPEVSVVGLDGRRVNVSHDAGSDVFSSWSPDGKWLAVFSDRGDGVPRLYAMRPDGSEVRLLGDAAPHVALQPQTPPPTASWSPDGAQVAFETAAGTGTGVAVVGVASPSLRIVATGAFGPSWSPDGRWISYFTRKGPGDELLVVRPDGTDAHRIALVDSGTNVAWSPDGRLLAFPDVSWPEAARGTFIVDPNGGEPVRVSASSLGSLAWSPDGSRLAGIANGTVVVLPLDGGGQSAVAAVSGPSEIAWSPDGRLLAFRGQDYELGVYDTRTGATRALGSCAGRLYWAPTRPVLPCESSGAGERDALELVAADGSGRATVAVIRARDSRAWVSSPWSPRGDAIAYTWARRTRQAIFSVNPDGSGLVQLTHDPAHDSSAPSWSPDHRRIAYASYGDLWVMDARGRGAHRIVKTQKRNLVPWSPIVDPAWAPDGRTIAFTDDEHVLVVNAAGGRVRTLTAGPGIVQEPAWSPDGRSLAYNSCDGSQRGGDCAIYLVGADGRGRHRLVGGRERCGPPGANPAGQLSAYSPAWSPDGRRIAYVIACYMGRFWDSPGSVETSRPDGTGRRLLLGPETWIGPGPNIPLDASNARWAWSPDGKKLALGGYRLATASLDSGTVTLLPSEMTWFQDVDW